ncbi:unnamed protein product [Adineta ricciae]|uniref:Glomulin-like protein n=1 Tax=Adineta ricciae TaxID=249248 RepID=A0A813WIJ6_ADIRI|nr:unnamed protein product [Adineta ricciae]CAF1063171.1 unnamed protein product [Adineta ricciae]
MTESSSTEQFYPNTLIVKEISSFIDNEQYDQAYNYLIALTDQQIYDGTWDLCTYLFYLGEKSTDKLCNENEIYAQDALKYVAEHGNPREMLIIMLEQSDKFITDDAFLFHMKLFLLILKRLPIKPSLINSLQDILTLLQCHLHTLEIPAISHDFAGKDLLVFNHDHRINRLLKLTQACVEFFCELRDYFSTTTVIDIRSMLTKSLITLLQDPLIALSYEPINSQESSSYTSIRPLLDCLFTLTPNPIRIIDKDEQQSTLVYLLLTKDDNFNRLPCVYSPSYYLFLSIPFILQLSQDHERVMLTEKACTLTSSVCSRLVPGKEFDQSILDNNQLHELIDALKILLVRSPARQYASLTIGAYRSLFQAFTPLGRYDFLRQQLAKTSYREDSYRTFLCTLFKDEFLSDYRSGSSEIYKGALLFQLLDYLCRLPNGVESDLLEIYDCLCSSLNLIRFIGLVDKQSVNRTLFWSERLTALNETFMKPLRKSIQLARAHYKLEIRNKNDDNNQQVQQPVNTEILVDNMPLAMPNKQEQLETLHTAVTKFDVLDCILSSLSDTFAGEL